MAGGACQMRERKTGKQTRLGRGHVQSVGVLDRNFGIMFSSLPV